MPRAKPLHIRLVKYRSVHGCPLRLSSEDTALRSTRSAALNCQLRGSHRHFLSGAWTRLELSMANVEAHHREATRHSQSRKEGMELEDLEKKKARTPSRRIWRRRHGGSGEEGMDSKLEYVEEVEALEMSDCSSDEDWAVAAVPSQLIPMSAGEIVKLLPRLSPSLREALLGCGEIVPDAGLIILHDGTLERLFELTLKPSFGAELKAQVGCRLVGGEVGSDVILQQLSLCLLLATAASLPDIREINIYPLDGKRMYLGEQAVEVLFSALASQHLDLAPDKGVQRLRFVGPFRTDTGFAHLAHLLKSRHCRLQKLMMGFSATGAGGIHHIARALRTNTSLTQLEISFCPEVGDGGVEQLATMLRTNSTLQELTLESIGMTAHGLRHLCAALSTQQSPQATSSPPRETFGGLKTLDTSYNDIGEGGAAHLGAMLAKNRSLRTLRAEGCFLVDEEGHIAKGLRENSTLERLDLSCNKQLGKVAVDLLVRSLATNNNTNLKILKMDEMVERPPWSRRHSQDDLQLQLEDHSKKPLKLPEKDEGETIPKTAAGSQNSCLMRHDIRDMGFHDFDQEFDSDRILVLFKSDGTCTLDDDDEPQVHITFFHVEAMCYVLGIGVPHSSVVLKGDTIQVIGAAKGEGWRDLWTDPAYQQLYSPRILEVSFPTLRSLSIQRSLQYSTEESVQMFGLGVAGSDLVISGQRAALGEGNADRGREMGRQAGKGKSTASREGEGTPDKKPVRDQTSGSGISSGATGPTTKADQPTAAVTEAHTLTIEVILSPDDNDIEPCEPVSQESLAEDRIALTQFIMDTVLTVTFYQDQDFSSPSKEMDIKVRSRYGLQTFVESTSAPRNTEFESFGWYHNGLRTSFQALDSDASFLQETTANTTPGSSGPTLITGGEVVRGGQLGVRAGGGSVPVSFSGQLTSSSTTSRQVSVPSTFQATNVGDRTNLAWITELQPGIKPAGLMDEDTERERATCAGLLNTVTTEFKGHWNILRDDTDPPHYSYDLVVSRRFYMLRRKKPIWSNRLRTRVITEKVFEQKLTKRFLINHGFSHMLDATRKFRWTLREMPECPVDVMRV